MTREEALEWFKDRKKMNLDDKCQQAEDMAIKALEQEPCEDAVSRKAAIEAVGYCRTPTTIKGRIQALSSVQPKQKTGHWNKHGRSETYTCSECEYWVGVKYNYCPNCGRKMMEV